MIEKAKGKIFEISGRESSYEGKSLHVEAVIVCSQAQLIPGPTIPSSSQAAHHECRQ